MIVLLQHLWPALAVAAALGLGVAALFGPGSGLPSARLEVRIGAVALLAAALLLVALEAVPGRPGLWLDIATLCALAYAAGIVLGTIGRRLALRRTRDPAPPPAVTPDAVGGSPKAGEGPLLPTSSS